MGYKEIELTKGRVAIVDADMFDQLNQYNWWFQVERDGTDNGYAYTSKTVKGKKKKIYMHRLIMDCPEGLVVDHRDNDGLNNRKYNLRRATYGNNNINQRPNFGGASKYKGVSTSVTKRSTSKKWRACIHLRKKHITIGRYFTEKAAAKAYDKKAVELYGEFAYLNFPDEHDLPPPF